MKPKLTRPRPTAADAPEMPPSTTYKIGGLPTLAMSARAPQNHEGGAAVQFMVWQSETALRSRRGHRFSRITCNPSDWAITSEAAGMISIVEPNDVGYACMQRALQALADFQESTDPNIVAVRYRANAELRFLVGAFLADLLGARGEPQGEPTDTAPDDLTH